jgi:hypothetical protein
MQLNASSCVWAHRNGRPAITAPSRNISRCVDSSTEVIAPPADNPVTNTRFGSTFRVVRRWLTMLMIEVTSAPLRLCREPMNHEKHDPFAVVCGYSSMNPCWSASPFQPAFT